jgi:hypothetical protein
MLRTAMAPFRRESQTPQSRLRFDLAHLSPEAQLLVLLARTSANGTLQVEIQDRLRDRVDWNLLWQLARTQSVAPLVYRMLLSYGRGVVPTETMETFRRHVQARAMLSQLLTDELATLVESFAANGLGVAPLSGPTLALMAYGDLALRECADLDFIVRHDSRVQVRRLLWSRGYHLTEGGPYADEQQESSNCFVKKNGMFRVNLHSTMARPFLGIDLERQQFWNSLKPVKIGQRTIMTLGQEELLIMLCMHGARYVWEDLRSVCDVAELVRRRRGIDWSRVLFVSREWRCRRLFLMGLATAYTLFDTPLPRLVQIAIEADPDIPHLARRMPEQLLRVREDGIEVADAEAFYLTLKDTWKEQCTYALTLCHAGHPVTGKSPAWFRLSGQLNLMYRLFHPVRRVEAWCAGLQGVGKSLARWLEISE